MGAYGLREWEMHRLTVRGLNRLMRARRVEVEHQRQQLSHG